MKTTMAIKVTSDSDCELVFEYLKMVGFEAWIDDESTMFSCQRHYMAGDTVYVVADRMDNTYLSSVSVGRRDTYKIPNSLVKFTDEHRVAIALGWIPFEKEEQE